MKLTGFLDFQSPLLSDEEWMLRAKKVAGNEGGQRMVPAMFQTVKEVIEEARKGRVMEIPVWEEGKPYDFDTAEKMQKLNLLAMHAYVTITLTKKACWEGGYQLRGWVRNPGFSGSRDWDMHVDGFGHGALFEFRGGGKIDGLKSLVDQYLVNSWGRRFEDDLYVVWV